MIFPEKRTRNATALIDDARSGRQIKG